MDFVYPRAAAYVSLAAVIGVLPTIWNGVYSIFKLKITIDTFNSFAFLASLMTGEVRSAAFIALMLTFARLLDWITESRTQSAVEELLKLKPSKALRVKGEQMEEIAVDAIRENDVLLVKTGDRIPVDGVVVFGSAKVSEAPVTGESALVEKVLGDIVLSSTLNESGTIKIRANRVGKDSTLERMVALINEAAKHKSRSEKVADRFATIFLPIVVIIGGMTFLITHNLKMTIAIFLVACADDMAVAIPLAMTAALGRAAKRGVIIKGGEWLEALGKIKTLILDKTGTLTYGKLALSDVHIEKGISEDKFWLSVAVAEKFSEHPVGKAIFREAVKRVGEVPDPQDSKIYKGEGIQARNGKDVIIIGNENIFKTEGLSYTKQIQSKLKLEREQHNQTTVLVIINKVFCGIITIADVPRINAKQSIKDMKKAGIANVVIFTGDNKEVGSAVAKSLGISQVRAQMTPEDKLRGIEEFSKIGIVGMVGDGINDAPALARANVGIAMGSGGTAVAVGAADVVILTDDLSRIPEMVRLGRQTSSVVIWDMIIWTLSNVAGFALVFTGIAGPALASFYNFATDFLPLINSARLFKNSKSPR